MKSLFLATATVALFGNVQARSPHEKFLLSHGVNMNHLHKNIMKHITRQDFIRDAAKENKIYGHPRLKNAKPLPAPKTKAEIQALKKKQKKVESKGMWHHLQQFINPADISSTNEDIDTSTIDTVGDIISDPASVIDNPTTSIEDIFDGIQDGTTAIEEIIDVVDQIVEDIPEPLSFDELIQLLEVVAYGLIDGMSFESDDTCAAGLSNVVNYAVEAFNFRDVFNPSSTMKFTLAFQNLIVSGNSIYAYCELNHIANVFNDLIAFTNTQPWGQLGSRVIGFFIEDFSITQSCVEEGSMGGNYYDVGKCIGNTASLIMDFRL